jgi:transcriptional regulator with XRE-family HTH domain
MRRIYLGIGQEKLGEALGMAFQQVQKYERGANRMSASRLYDLSRVLAVPAQHFFDELEGMPPHAGYILGLSESPVAGFESEENAGREAFEVANLVRRITDRARRSRGRAHVPGSAAAKRRVRMRGTPRKSGRKGGK